MNLEDIELRIYFLKTCIISLYTCYTFLRITNNKTKLSIINLLCFMAEIVSINIAVTIIKYKGNSFLGVAFLISLLSACCSVNFRCNMGQVILAIIISLSINYILFFIGIIVCYFINTVNVIENDYINLIIMVIVHTILLIRTLNIKRIKNGFSFFNKTKSNEYVDIIILEISVCILFTFILFSSIQKSSDEIIKSLTGVFIILAIIMIVTVQKVIQIYYKQKLLIKDLNETKQELENKKQEISELEQENLTISKRNHSLDHKQKALEYKLNELSLKYEIAEEIDIKDKLNSISKELYKKQVKTELSKTGITEIDDMLQFMQSECTANKIDFDLQINGNVYQMINNIISKEELSILIADHVKDAIIAIKHTDNINKSILVRLGKIDDCYGLYIYDSGIEFEKETLENLGKHPSTTHADEGGTGIGFMNTFETLRKHKASLIIKELGKPSKENYTKVIMIKFDNKNEFKIDSYRN